MKKEQTIIRCYYYLRFSRMPSAMQVKLELSVYNSWSSMIKYFREFDRYCQDRLKMNISTGKLKNSYDGMRRALRALDEQAMLESQYEFSLFVLSAPRRHKRKSLVIPVKRDEYRNIVKGRQREIYRDICPVWTRRLVNPTGSKPRFKNIEIIILRLKTARGYRRSKFRATHICIGYTKPKWTADRNLKKCYIVSLRKWMK